MNEELLKKSLEAQGLSAEQIATIMAGAKAEPEVTEESLQKSLSDMAETLKAAAAGNVPEAELNERIQKAIDGVTDKYEKHAKTLGAVTDTYVAAHKAEIVELRKAVAVQGEVIGKLTTAVFDLKKAIGALPAPAPAVKAEDVAEVVTKSLSAALVPQSKAVTIDNAPTVVPHPGDKVEDVKKGLSVADALKILKGHPDQVIANKVRIAIAQGMTPPAEAFAQHRIPLPQA